MKFSRPVQRLGPAAVFALLPLCAGCWEEIRYEAPPEAAAEVGAGQGKPIGNPGKVAAVSPSMAEAPSVAELFSGEPPLVNDPGEAPAPADPGPIAGGTTPGASDTMPSAGAPRSPVEIVVPAPPAVTAPTAAERLAAWTLASNWSLVATLQTKGIAPDRYASYLAAAREAGDSLGIAAPPLPTGDTPATLDAATIEDLQTGAGAKLADAVAARLDDEAGAAARLAVRAHLLLLTYTPAGSTVWGDAADIREAGVESGLPAELWRPLVEELQGRAEYLDVRKAVFTLRDGVSAHLAE
jgi:hypothetical protein